MKCFVLFYFVFSVFLHVSFRRLFRCEVMSHTLVHHVPQTQRREGAEEAASRRRMSFQEYLKFDRDQDKKREM